MGNIGERVARVPISDTRALVGVIRSAELALVGNNSVSEYFRHIAHRLYGALSSNQPRITQRHLTVPPDNRISRNGNAGNGNSWTDLKGIQQDLDLALKWIYTHGGSEYDRFGDLIYSGGLVCTIDYKKMEAVFEYGTSHELEPTLRDRGFAVAYKAGKVEK